MYEINVFLVFVIVFYLYAICNKPHILFFSLVMLSIAFYYHKKTVAKSAEKISTVDKYMTNVAQELEKNPEVMSKNVFKIHQLHKIKYVLKDTYLKDILFDLKFLRIYDNAEYMKLVLYIEYFLKIHYITMLGKYDVDTNLHIMIDIRNEILNILKSFHMNIPTKSSVLDIPNLDDYLDKKLVKIQTVTYKYLKIVVNKYKSNVNILKPFGTDKSLTEHYELY